jgi:putative SOS response-associated peptidase YedK
MCYRVSTPTERDLEDQFNATLDNPDQYVPYYHISGFDAPSLPAITYENPKLIQLIPWKSKAEFNTLNAKSETLFDTYFKSFTDRRCLILVSGFFEHRDFNKKKYPYFVKPKSGKGFAIGGIVSKDNTLSIITTPANPLMAKIHNTKLRMPLILPKDSYSKWLSKDLMKEEVKDLMLPYPENEMDAYTISTMITKKGIDTNVEEVLKRVHFAELDAPTLF